MTADRAFATTPAAIAAARELLHHRGILGPPPTATNQVDPTRL